MSLANMLGGIIDKEKAITESIQNTIEDVSIELNCEPKELFIMIKPTGEKFSFLVYLYKIAPDKAPELVRKMQMTEFTDN